VGQLREEEGELAAPRRKFLLFRGNPRRQLLLCLHWTFSLDFCEVRLHRPPRARFDENRKS
jgi:hypothetical protein